MQPLEDVLRKVEDLKRDLSSDIVIQEEVGHYNYPRIETWDPAAGEAANSAEIGEYTEAHKKWVIDKPLITKAMEAEKELKNIYSSSEFIEARKVAGEFLHYSPLRIWAHEHPVAATVTGIAAVGVASGLGHMLLQYFSK